VTVTIFDIRSKKREIRQGAKKGDCHRFGKRSKRGRKGSEKKVTVTIFDIRSKGSEKR